jgi:hypothetical protein
MVAQLHAACRRSGVFADPPDGRHLPKSGQGPVPGVFVIGSGDATHPLQLGNLLTQCLNAGA